MLFAFLIFIGGYKHNKFIFFIQTFCFIAFKIDESHLVSIYIGHELRYSYLNFDKNIFQSSFKDNYFEYSLGNYCFLTMDNNIFRVAGINLFIAFTNLAVIFILFVILLLKIDFISYLKRLRFSKIIFRSMEFIYKMPMYPLIFFSFENVINWNRSSFL